MIRPMGILALLMFCTLLAASGFDPYINPHYQLPSLLNPDKLHVSHSASFSAGSCSNGQGFYQSVYSNHMLYQFNSKLDLAVNLNFVNGGTTTMKGGLDIEGNGDNNTRVLPDIGLQWRPSENTTLRIEYTHMRPVNPYPLRYWPER